MSRQQIIQGKAPYLLLLLIPLSFVGLDSFGYFTHPAPPNQASGLWPRKLPSQTRTSLSLNLPAEGLSSNGLRLTSTTAAPLDLPAQIEGSHWQVELPALTEGEYQLQLLSQGQPFGATYPLSIEAKPFWQLKQDRPFYRPGDWLVLSLQQNSAQPLKLEVLDAQGQQLSSQTLPARAGLWPLRLRLPEQTSPGQGRILLRQQTRLLEQQSLQILAASSPGSSSLQLLQGQTQLIRGLEQEVELYLLDAQGLPAQEGWLRVADQTLQIHQGVCRLKVSANQAKLDFAAGDNKGNLLQGKLQFDLQDLDWLPHHSQEPQPGIQVYSRRAQNLSWVLSQHKQIKGQGLSQLKSGLNRLRLPPLLAGEPSWLQLCDPLGHCQQISWMATAQKVSWLHQPETSNALSPLRFSPAIGPSKGLNAPLESFRYQLQGLVPWQAAAATADFLLQPVGFPEPARPHPWLQSIWAVAGALLAGLPLLWLWYHLNLERAGKGKPFPSTHKRQASHKAQWLALGTAAGSLLALCLSWLASHWPAAYALASSGSSLGSLLTASLLSHELRSVFYRVHPLARFVPLLQAILLCLLSWFALSYQPSLLGASLLLLSLSALAWAQLVQQQIPLRSLQRFQQLGLASLVVAGICHQLILTRQSQPLPLWLQTPETLRLSALNLLADSRLLSYQHFIGGSDQILAAARRSGPQLLSWRSWSDPPQSFEQSLNVKPTVLAEASLPSYLWSGDRLVLPIQLRNETTQTQNSAWRLSGAVTHQSQPLQLAPQAALIQYQPLQIQAAGWQNLVLSHQYQGSWYPQNQRIYVLRPEAAVDQPFLKLELGLPASKGLVVNEEIPVLVKFRHRSPQTSALGLQIYFPSGFSAISDTLSDRRHQSWLAEAKQTPESLQIRTKPLKPDQEVNFHFRLRPGFPGLFQMPPASLFFLDQPQELTRLKSDTLFEVKAHFGYAQ